MTTPAAPAAPAAPVAPAPAQEAPVQPAEKQVSFDDNIDDELGALDDDPGVSAPAKQRLSSKKPETPPKEEKEEEGTKEKTAEEELDELDGKPKPKEEDKPKEPDKPMKAADLRSAYDTLKKRVREDFEPQIASLQSKIKELESKRIDESPLHNEIKSLREGRDELEKRVRFLDYKESDEFREKYQKPYHEAWQRALADLSELTIADEGGNERAATAQDLMMLANMKLGEARVKARQLFGDAADDVMTHRRIIRELSEAQNKALEDAKTNSVERAKKLDTERQIQHQEAQRLWKEANESLSKKYPKWFAEVEGDESGNSLLKKGFALADLHFISAKGLSPEQIEALPERFRDAIKSKGDLDLKDRVALDALLRNKIASHSRLASSLKQARDRIKELESTLAEYENSEPPSTTGRRKKGELPSNSIDEAMSELDAIDKKFE